MSENPYEAPQFFEAPPGEAPTDAEVIRKAHIKTEASIKSVGILYYLGAIGLTLAGIGALIAGINAGGEGAMESMGIGTVCVILGVLYFAIGSAIRKFKPWSKVAVGIFSGLGLLGFPVGTLINGYILFLVFGKKGGMVFSEPYKEIIAATPHVKYKTSKAVWIILGVIVALILFGVIAVVVGSSR